MCLALCKLMQGRDAALYGDGLNLGFLDVSTLGDDDELDEQCDGSTADVARSVQRDKGGSVRSPPLSPVFPMRANCVQNLSEPVQMPQPAGMMGMAIAYPLGATGSGFHPCLSDELLLAGARHACVGVVPNNFPCGQAVALGLPVGLSEPSHAQSCSCVGVSVQHTFLPIANDGLDGGHACKSSRGTSVQAWHTGPLVDDMPRMTTPSPEMTTCHPPLLERPPRGTDSLSLYVQLASELVVCAAQPPSLSRDAELRRLQKLLVNQGLQSALDEALTALE